MPRISPPDSESQLMQRANAIAGLTLGEIAARSQVACPADLKRHKGWSGQLLERVLGADAHSLPQPDFMDLGIELKTIPVNHSGNPKESTYVCTVPINQTLSETWTSSWVYQKLQRVLWIPILIEADAPPLSHRLGMPLLWSPTSADNQLLQTDWEELMEYIWMGRIDELSSHVGEVLQIRPKAANAAARGVTSSANGELTTTVPRGFYLRSSFTQTIINQHYISV